MTLNGDIVCFCDDGNDWSLDSVFGNTTGQLISEKGSSAQDKDQ